MESGAAPFPSLIASYIDGRRQAGLSASTLSIQRKVLRLFARLLAARGVATPAGIDRRGLEAFIDFLQDGYRIPSGTRRGQRLANSTRYGWFGAVLAFVEYLVREGQLLVDPRGELARPRCIKRRRRLVPSVADVGRFLEAIATDTPRGVRDRALFELIYSTGLRAGEASHLDLYDLDLAAGTLRVREGKGGKDRVVPVGREASRWLRRYLEEIRPLWARRGGCEAVFLTRRGTRMSTTMIHIDCRRWRRLAGLPWLTPHALRHAVATHMLAAGADIRHVQELLGHAWITTTNLYTHVVIGDLVRVHRRTHPREARRR